VRVRDLPLAGRPTVLVWRKRRLGCQACGCTFTETHPELPARQRVTARFRRRLLERVRGGAAHAEVAREEQTTRYLRSLPEQDRRVIEVVSIDPYDAYRQAIRAELPHARIVCDHFHLVRGANTALDSIRRERQRQHGRRRPKGARRSGHGATWQPELYRARHRLLRARERLTERDRRRLCELFARDPILAEAWAGSARAVRPRPAGGRTQSG
jgi:transposase